MVRFLLPRALLAGIAALFAPTAFALFSLLPSTTVIDPVQNLGGNTWSYSYRLNNQTTCLGNCNDTFAGKPIATFAGAIREFSLPYFSDAGITALLSPANWSATILAENRFGLLGSQTLVWTALTDTAGIALGANLAGFGYRASFAAGKGPFETILGIGGAAGTFHGDPAIPRSPNAILAGIPPLGVLPEPGSSTLAALGLVMLLMARRKTA